MKTKLTIIAACTAGLFASAQAQEFVAGWDFSQFAGSGFSTTDNATFATQANANFVRSSAGSFVGVAGVNTAPNYGVIHYDGSFGSSVFDLNAQLYNGGEDAGTFNSPGGSLGSSGQINTLVAQGQNFGNAQAMSLGSNREGQSIVIAMDMSSYFDGFTAGSDWNLTYAARTNDTIDGVSNIAWEYSLDGSAYTFLENDALTSSLTGYTLDLSAAGETSQLFVRATFSGIDNNALYVDNVMVNASPVPEPSAFAAIFGVLALGFAAVRRRRQA